MLKLSRFAWLALGALLLPTAAVAQDFPSRPIKLIVPFPAGGPADTIARIYAERMQALLGQTVIVDNRGGAGGITGVDATAKAEPNGYTIVLSSPGALAINPSVQTNMPYNVQKDLKPISLAVQGAGNPGGRADREGHDRSPSCWRSARRRTSTSPRPAPAACRISRPSSSS